MRPAEAAAAEQQRREQEAAADARDAAEALRRREEKDPAAQQPQQQGVGGDPQQDEAKAVHQGGGVPEVGEAATAERCAYDALRSALQAGRGQNGMYHFANAIKQAIKALPLQDNNSDGQRNIHEYLKRIADETQKIARRHAGASGLEDDHDKARRLADLAGAAENIAKDALTALRRAGVPDDERLVSGVQRATEKLNGLRQRHPDYFSGAGAPEGGARAPFNAERSAQELYDLKVRLGMVRQVGLRDVPVLDDAALAVPQVAACKEKYKDVLSTAESTKKSVADNKTGDAESSANEAVRLARKLSDYVIEHKDDEGLSGESLKQMVAYAENARSAALHATRMAAAKLRGFVSAGIAAEQEGGRRDWYDIDKSRIDYLQRAVAMHQLTTELPQDQLAINERGELTRVVSIVGDSVDAVFNSLKQQAGINDSVIDADVAKQFLDAAKNNLDVCKLKLDCARLSATGDALYRPSAEIRHLEEEVEKAELYHKVAAVMQRTAKRLAAMRADLPSGPVSQQQRIHCQNIARKIKALEALQGRVQADVGELNSGGEVDATRLAEIDRASFHLYNSARDDAERSFDEYLGVLMQQVGDGDDLEDFPAILDDAEEEVAADVQVDGEKADAQRRDPHRQAPPQPMAVLRGKVTLAQEAVNALEQTVKGGGSEGGGAAHGAVKAAYDKALAAYQRAMQLIPQGDGDAQEIVATKAELAKMKADLDHFSESLQPGSDAENGVGGELSMTGTAQVSVEVLPEEETQGDFAMLEGDANQETALSQAVTELGRLIATAEGLIVRSLEAVGLGSGGGTGDEGGAQSPDPVGSYNEAKDAYDTAQQKFLNILDQFSQDAEARLMSVSDRGQATPNDRLRFLESQLNQVKQKMLKLKRRVVAVEDGASGNRHQDPDAGPTGGGSNHDAPAPTGSSSNNTTGTASTAGGNDSGLPAGDNSADDPVDQDFSELDDETEEALTAYNRSVAEFERELKSLESLNFKPHEYATTPAVLLKAKAFADSAKALLAIEADDQEVKDRLRGHLTQVMGVINPDGYTPSGQAEAIVQAVAGVLEQIRGARLTDSAEEKLQDTYDPVELAKNFAAQACRQDDDGHSLAAARMYEQEAEAWLEAGKPDRAASAYGNASSCYLAGNALTKSDSAKASALQYLPDELKAKRYLDMAANPYLSSAEKRDHLKQAANLGSEDARKAQLQDLLEQSRELHLQSLTKGDVVQNDSAQILKQISRLIRLDDPVTQDRVDTVGIQLQQQREMLDDAPELSGSDLHDSLAQGLKQVMDEAVDADESANEALMQRAEASVTYAKKVLGDTGVPDAVQDQFDRLDAIKHSRLSKGSGHKKQ